MTAPARILAISRMIDIGYPNPRIAGTAMVAAAVLWSLWRTRNRADSWLMSAVGAFGVHWYAVLSAQVHENHLFGAVPCLVLAAAGRPAFRPILIAVSVIEALNLNLFYGFGDGVGYGLPRSLTVIDATVVLSAISCAVFCWHAVVLHRESSKAAAPRQMSMPASDPRTGSP